MSIGRFLSVNRAVSDAGRDARQFALPGGGSRRFFGFLHRWRISGEHLADAKAPGASSRRSMRGVGFQLLK